jgi:hypothetical protein
VTIDADARNISRYSVRHEILKSRGNISAVWKEFDEKARALKAHTEEVEALREAEEDRAALVGTQEVSTPEILLL